MAFKYNSLQSGVEAKKIIFIQLLNIPTLPDADIQALSALYIQPLGRAQINAKSLWLTVSGPAGVIIFVH
jgi:hypothetical protein